MPDPRLACSSRVSGEDLMVEGKLGPAASFGVAALILGL